MLKMVTTADTQEAQQKQLKYSGIAFAETVATYHHTVLIFRQMSYGRLSVGRLAT